MWHDPEVPAGYQDADIEMREMAEAANEQAAACARGDHEVNDSVLAPYCIYCMKNLLSVSSDELKAGG